MPVRTVAPVLARQAKTGYLPGVWPSVVLCAAGDRLSRDERKPQLVAVASAPGLMVQAAFLHRANDAN